MLTGTEGVTVKLAKELKGLTSTDVSGIVTNASGIAMADKKCNGKRDNVNPMGCHNIDFVDAKA